MSDSEDIDAATAAVLRQAEYDDDGEDGELEAGLQDDPGETEGTIPPGRQRQLQPLVLDARITSIPRSKVLLWVLASVAATVVVLSQLGAVRLVQESGVPGPPPVTRPSAETCAKLQWLLTARPLAASIDVQWMVIKQLPSDFAAECTVKLVRTTVALLPLMDLRDALEPAGDSSASRGSRPNFMDTVLGSSSVVVLDLQNIQPPAARGVTHGSYHDALISDGTTYLYAIVAEPKQVPARIVSTGRVTSAVIRFPQRLGWPHVPVEPAPECVQSPSDRCRDSSDRRLHGTGLAIRVCDGDSDEAGPVAARIAAMYHSVAKFLGPLPISEFHVQVLPATDLGSTPVCSPLLGVNVALHATTPLALATALVPSWIGGYLQLSDAWVAQSLQRLFALMAQPTVDCLTALNAHIQQNAAAAAPRIPALDAAVCYWLHIQKQLKDRGLFIFFMHLMDRFARPTSLNPAWAPLSIQELHQELVTWSAPSESGGIWAAYNLYVTQHQHIPVSLLTVEDVVALQGSALRSMYPRYSPTDAV